MIRSPLFHIGLLSRYQLLVKPGTHIVTVGYTVTDANYILDENPRYLVPLRVVTGEGLEKILSIVDGGSKTVPFDKVRKHFLIGALWDTDGEIQTSDLPIKGERVNATFDYVGERLLCTHLELLPKEELDFVDIGAIDEFKNDILKLLNKNEIT